MIIEPAESIRFHRLKDPYGCFTNFARFPVILDGRLWPTSEHYFQAQKFTDSDHIQRICNAVTPSLAAKYGRSRDFTVRADWSTTRVSVMRRVAEAKFRQHPRLATKLLATGSAELIEDTRREYFWADGGNGKGLNMNGRILMELRALLTRQANADGCRIAQILRQLPRELSRQSWVLFADNIVVCPPRAAGSTVVRAAGLLREALASATLPLASKADLYFVGHHGSATVPRVGFLPEVTLVYEPAFIQTC